VPRFILGACTSPLRWGREPLIHGHGEGAPGSTARNFCTIVGFSAAASPVLDVSALKTFWPHVLGGCLPTSVSGVAT
jgi:hypothetical protein